MEYKDPVFYTPADNRVIDLAVMRDGELRSAVYNEPLGQVRLRYPGAEIGEWEPIAKAHEESFRHPPQEITEERYHTMLEILPPVGWIQRDGESTFKLAERTSGNITAIFAWVGGRYYEMSDSIYMSHDEIIARVRPGTRQG